MATRSKKNALRLLSFLFLCITAAVSASAQEVYPKRVGTPIVITGPENYTLADSTFPQDAGARVLDVGLQKVSEGATPELMAAALLGSASNLEILSASYVGSGDASGIITTFPADHYLKPSFGTGAIVLTTGDASLSLVVPNDSGSSSAGNDVPGDAQLSENGFDASVLVIELQATEAGSLSFAYAFASEEYPEFVGSNFNDVFRLLVDDVDVAKIPGSGDIVTINNVNLDKNAEFFTLNPVGTA